MGKHVSERAKVKPVPEGERMSARKAEVLTNALLEYYRVHGRDLPWRRTKDPYAILVSELMLQQTQVSRVIPKWEAWLKAFPTLRDLALADTATILRLWSGLGYNSRALRLRELAIVVMKEWKGELPQTPEALLSLPGIGPYTANAVASFAFGADVLAMDTNLKRVLGRYFGKPGATFAIPNGAGRMVNGALMDIGSSVCGRKPDCEVCPLFATCATRGRARFEVQKKTPQAFAESDRCIRGSVLRELLKVHESHTGKGKIDGKYERRGKHKQRVNAVDMAWLCERATERCVNVTEERMQRILHALAKAGLVKLSGKRVMLPK